VEGLDPERRPTGGHPGESLASATATRPPSRRAVDLVAAYGVAQWNVVQVKMMGGAEADFRRAKERQVEAYGALMAYIAELEGRAVRGA
jgi:hypothetical protein